MKSRGGIAGKHPSGNPLFYILLSCLLRVMRHHEKVTLLFSRRGFQSWTRVSSKHTVFFGALSLSAGVSGRLGTPSASTVRRSLRFFRPFFDGLEGGWGQALRFGRKIWFTRFLGEFKITAMVGSNRISCYSSKSTKIPKNVKG